MKKITCNLIISVLVWLSFAAGVCAYDEWEAINATQNGLFDFPLKTIETYYSQDFENTADVSEVAGLSNTLPGMGITLADAGEELIGSSGNRVLKLELDAANAKDERTVNLPLQKPHLTIGSGKRLQFQLDFYKTNPLTNLKFFILGDSRGRSKHKGLVQLMRDGAPVYGDRFHDGTDNLIFGDDLGTTDEEMGEIAPERWYRINVLWTVANAETENRIEKISVTSLADEKCIFEVNDIPVVYESWPLCDIASMSLGVATYNNFPAQAIYYDNISIKEVADIDEITSVWTVDKFEEFFDSAYEPAVVTRSFEPLCDDAYSRVMIHKIKAYADSQLLKGDIYTANDFPDDNLSYARKVLDVSFMLGYLYRTTEKSEYADFLDRQLMQFATDFSSWPDYSFLHVAEGLAAMSAGYTWGNGGISEETKNKIHAAVKPRLDLALTFYEPEYRFVAVDWGNQSTVANCALIMSACAFANEYTSLCAKLMHHSARGLRAALAALYPDGASLEGPGYWQLQTVYMAYAFSTLDAVFGTDFDLSKAGPLEKTGLYHLNMHSSDSIAFNFSDSGAEKPQVMALYYLAKKFNQPYLSDFADYVFPEGVDYTSWQAKHGDVMGLLWRTGSNESFENLPLNAVYGGKQAVSIERSGFYPGATYFAMKGGNARNYHGSMDAGSFVLDSMGERWAEDLGAEDYGGAGYWDYTDEGRWSYYSQRAEGHNTLVINPTDGADQNNDAVAVFKERNTLDFGNMYPGNRVTRSYEMTDEGHGLMLTDIIEPETESDIYWFMHTQKAIEASGNTAVLKSGSKKCTATILSPQGAEFTVEEAKPLIIENNPDAKSFDKYKKLRIHVKADNKTEIKVAFAFENDEFLIENTLGKTVHFNRRIDFSESTAKATDLHGNEIDVKLKRLSDFSLEFTPEFMHPDNVYFINFEGVTDKHGNRLSGETVVSLGDSRNFDDDIYYNGFDDEFIAENEPWEVIATRNKGGESRLMMYADSSAATGIQDFYTTELINAGKNRVVFECDILTTYSGNEKKLFRLSDKNGAVKCDYLLSLMPMAENNDYRHSWVKLAGGSYFTDEATGENYRLALNKPHRIKVAADFSVYPARLCSVSITDLTNGHTVCEEYTGIYIYSTEIFSVGIGHKVWKSDTTYFDNLSVHYEREGFKVISVENENTAAVTVSNYENPDKIYIFAAAYDDRGALTDVVLKKPDTVIGINRFEFDNVSGKNRRIFIWSEECVPYV